MAKSEVCPCGGKSFVQCCGRYLNQALAAPTAEALMRSRYSAFVLKDEPYLKSTWHTTTRPHDAIIDPNDGAKWLGLEVRKHVEKGDQATVEFVARYKVAGRAHRLHEVSNFVREEGRWFYVDGIFPA